MKDKLPRKKEGKLTPRLRFAYDAITVGSGRSAEPYIIAFHYKSDNVAGKNLGTLFGFFEVEVHDEDAAYIVNFLASVAKKEYFANPRRPVEDGFETTLHKVNVALAEITKEGNVSWLGHLHGILGAVSEATVHFSATGDGVLSLAREDSLRPISDGLAENVSDPHPLKTFTEVASGELVPGDVLLALSPSVWTLFTPDDLKKNLGRFSPAEFGQFLKTALINELSLAGAVVVRVSADTTTTAPLPKHHSSEGEAVPAKLLANVWGKQAFERAKAARLTALEARETSTDEATPSSDERHEEYIDQKTGHIYVQGERDGSPQKESAWQTKLSFVFQSSSRFWFREREKLSRAARRFKKSFGFFMANTGTFTARLSRSVSRRARVLFRRLREAREARAKARAETQAEAIATQVASESLMTPPVPPLPSASEWQVRLAACGGWLETKWHTLRARTHWPTFTRPAWQTSIPRPSVSLPTGWISTLRERLAQALGMIAGWLRSLAARIAPSAWNLWGKKRFLLIALGLLLVLGLFLAGRSMLRDTPSVAETPATPVETPTPSPSVPEESEPLAIYLGDRQPLTAPLEGAVVSLVRINDTALAITKSHIVNTATQESIATPEPLRLAAAMDDLDALFLLGESGTLHMFTIANKKFETSTLPLPAGAKVDALGAYLTYLYVLDRDAQAIYRFPRSEGGFGPPVTWSRESFALAGDTPLAVNESIALLSPDHALGLYERGRKTTATFAGTKDALAPTSFTFDKASGHLLTLDPTHERVVRYAPSGTLIAQYFHASFRDASVLLMGANNTLLVAQPEGVSAFPLP